VYKYFVSYTTKNGFGRCEITRETEIKGIDDIFGIEKIICESIGCTTVGILYYKLF
jgi:hypothetical protein